MFKGLSSQSMAWQRISHLYRNHSFIKDSKRFYCINYHLVKKTSDHQKVQASNYNCLNHVQQRYYSSKDTVDQASFLSKYLTTDSTPVKMTIEYVTYFHDLSGLPWWGSIILATFVARTCLTLPLSVFSYFNNLKVQAVQMELNEMKKILHVEADDAAKKLGLSEENKRKMILMNERRLVQKLYIRDNCHPMKSIIIVLIQIPLFIFMSFALRHLSGLSGEIPVAVGLTTEGLRWCTNLTLADPTLLIPCIYGIVYLSNILFVYYNANRKKQTLSKQMTIGLSLSGGLTVLLVPIASIMPTCMSLYWLSSAFYSLVQNIVINEPKIQSALGIPKDPIEILEKKGRVKIVRKSDKDDLNSVNESAEQIKDKAKNLNEQYKQK